MRFLLLITALLSSLGFYAQIDSVEIYNHTGMISYGGKQLFESEGYSYMDYYEYAKFDKNGVKKIERVFKIPKDVNPLESSLFPGAIEYTFKTDKKGNFFFNRIIVIPESELLVKVVSLFTSISRKPETEDFLLLHIANKSYPPSIELNLDVDSINFAGRFLKLGPICRWRSAHNMQCPDLGQISWSEFSSEERADEFFLLVQQIAENRTLTSIKSEEKVDILFEGVKTEAIKKRMKIRIPQLFFIGSNILEVYYVKVRVRNRFIICTLSQYYYKNAQELAPLLSEVMSLL